MLTALDVLKRQRPEARRLVATPGAYDVRVFGFLARARREERARLAAEERECQLQQELAALRAELARREGDGPV